MDAGLASLTVSSQRSGVSYGPLNIVLGECTRCGRPTEQGNIWSVCPSCTAGGSRPGAAPSPVQKLNQHTTATCAACRVALRVPPHYQSTHVLCPPCQARHAAAIGNPRPLDRARVPRANPYPVVTPIAKSTRAVVSTVAYTYPRIPAPSPVPSLHNVGTVNAGGGVHTSVNHAGDALRVCMRFGCGARLPPHLRGDMCEACASAGFTRPPRAVVQKHVSRHVMDCTPRPRESRDFAGTSMMREAVRGATVTTEREAVEDDMEVDLVYPDDIPVATQCASTSPESTNEKSKPIEDEDAEPELVYPEDVAEAAQASSSKPRTNLSAPITLRALFTDGLQTIHGLQDLTTLVDQGSERHCRTLGCNEALPAQTCMERCVKCSIGDWKRRRLASMNSSDPSQRSSTKSLTTTTSMEEKEVSTMLDETSDVEGENDPLPPSSPSKSSGNELTGDGGARQVPGWDSDLTELSDSESESVSDSDSDQDLELAGLHGDTTGLKIRIPLLAHRLPPDDSLRKCGNKKCNIALPKDHRWKTCEPCRRAQRTYQQMRHENIRRSVLGIERLTPPDLPCRRWRALSPDMYETDMSLTPETSRPCSTRKCRNRIPLSEVYQWKTCTVCRARSRRKARRKRDALVETQRAWRQPEVIPHFPAYQNRGALLSSFDAQLKGFVEGQIMYLRAKLHESGARGQGEKELWKPRHAPMLFVFVGEYSVVTGQKGDSEQDSHTLTTHDHSRSPDDPAELEAMRQEVSGVVQDLERALRTKFRPGEAFAIDKGGVIMQFTCSLELIAQLRPLATSIGPSAGPSSASDTEESACKDKDKEKEKEKNTSRENVPLTPQPPPDPTAIPLVKTLSGELEAVVVPDESHPFFRGRRTVIRYSMFG